MRLVMHGARIVAANHTGDAADAAVDNIIIQRPVGCAERAAQKIVDGLMGKPDHHVAGFFGNIRLALAVREVAQLPPQQFSLPN